MKTLRLATGLCGLAICLTSAATDTSGAKIRHLGKTADTDEIIRLLTPEADVAPARSGRRGLKIKDAEVTQAATATPTAKDLRGISLEVTFEFGSHALTDDSRALLDKVGAALGSRKLESYNFVVEGHTDSVGSREYNQALSERRAASVKGYLTQNFGIPSARLVTQGRGEDDLRDKKNPRSGVNRRVQIINALN